MFSAGINNEGNNITSDQFLIAPYIEPDKLESEGNSSKIIFATGE